MDVIETLRRAIKKADVSRYRISKNTGIAQSTMSRFVNNERGLELADFAVLCAHLGLTLTPNKSKKRKAR